MRHVLHFPALGAVCVLCFAALGALTPARAGGVDEEAGIPRGVEWRAVAIDGVPSAEGVRSTLKVDEAGGVSGSTGCNRFAGRLEGEGARVAFGQLATTRMACLPAAMDQDNRFGAALSAVRSAELDEEGRLRLLDGEGRARLIMTR
jgi:putative lipoprotein